MEKPYLILVDGKLADRKLTLAGAKKRAEELKGKGYNQVSIAHDLPVDYEQSKESYYRGMANLLKSYNGAK